MSIISRDWQIDTQKSFNIRMLIISWPWALSESGFLIICRISFLEKWQLTNKFSVSKVNYDDNALLSKNWRVENFTSFSKTNNVLIKNFALI